MPTKIMFHTQERRWRKLVQPIQCTRDDAWLGEGWYFWEDIEDAEYWGHTSKKKTGRFDIYIAEIDMDNVLDTVFNEEHYRFWVNQIKKAAIFFIKTTERKPTLKELNDYFREKGIWQKVAGILFQDLPKNENMLLVRPLERNGKKQYFNYRKRIQLVVYNQNIIVNFAFHKEEQCLEIY